uniref:Homing endonuclease LAGLIDADG domain-containing protein n=1 Tax=Orbilia brochopaga TaxID=3140254 RepID=A0A4Y5N074_9PEZI|nr:hypothetical protein [Drechslerella brochopaga]
MENPNNPTNLNPFFVTGFCDAEACFHLSIGKNSKYKIGYYVNPGFSIGLHKKDLSLLEKIQSYFGGIGTISKQTKNSIQFRIFSIKDLKIIIDHFEKYPLITKKQIDYKLFKQALELIENKEHINLDGFQKIVNMRASMNKGLPNSLKDSFSNVTIIEMAFTPLNIQDPNWLAGFAEGEGCFFVKTTKTNKNVSLGFQLTQHNRDALLINSFVSFFGCGRVESCNNGLAVNFIVTKLSDLIEKIIPFFNEYPIIGSKSKDLEDLKKIVKIKISKEHLTPEGFEKILKIKSGMNSLRFKI